MDLSTPYSKLSLSITVKVRIGIGRHRDGIGGI